MGTHLVGRRDFLTSAALATGALAGARLGWASPQDDADAVFDRSLVFDVLSNDGEWTDEVFAAFRRSGVDVIQTSLDNRSLAAALADLARWQARLDRDPDRLVTVVRGGDIADARRQGRIAVVLGFQNATMIETRLANLDELYALGTRCIQLTYNARNLLGDGCTGRTNAGLSDFGVGARPTRALPQRRARPRGPRRPRRRHREDPRGKLGALLRRDHRRVKRRLACVSSSGRARPWGSRSWESSPSRSA